MKKFLVFLLASIVTYTSLATSADASVRLLRGNRGATTYNPTYNTQAYTQPTYNSYAQPTYNYTVDTTTNSYYYSPSYIAGYTYYTSPTPGYYYYTNFPTQNTYYNSVQPTVRYYYYSANYIAGYTYYTTPTPGYYRYLDYPTTNPLYTTNGIAYTTSNYTYYATPNNTAVQNQPYYVSQNYGYNNGANNNYTYNPNNQYYYPQNYPVTSVSSSYPGCSTANIIIGGQEWSACNSTDRNTSSSAQSGWFFAGDVQSTFLSYNGLGNTLTWQGKQYTGSNYTAGPCASGYRLPTRGEWQTAIYYARQNGTTLTALLSLATNGGFRGYRDTSGNVTLSARTDVNGAYWSSSFDGSTPTVLHLGSDYAGYRTDGTDFTNGGSVYQWQYSNTGLNLVKSEYAELANVRCIRG